MYIVLVSGNISFAHKEMAVQTYLRAFIFIFRFSQIWRQIDMDVIWT